MSKSADDAAGIGERAGQDDPLGRPGFARRLFDTRALGPLADDHEARAER